MPAEERRKKITRRRRVFAEEKFGMPPCLAEDVFDFIEDRGVAVCRLIFHLHRSAELLDQFALVARELCWRQHTNVVVQIALAAAAGLGQSLALDAKNG